MSIYNVLRGLRCGICDEPITHAAYLKAFGILWCVSCALRLARLTCEEGKPDNPGEPENRGMQR